MCREYIMERINATNVWEMWEACYEVYQDELVDYCRKFVMDRGYEVFVSPSIVEASEEQLSVALGDHPLCEEIQVRVRTCVCSLFLNICAYTSLTLTLSVLTHPPLVVSWYPQVG
jgi:hypothetical protein